MTPKNPWDYTILTIRVGLGLYFFVFGLTKVVEGIPKFSRQVASFEILKDPWNMPVAYVVPWFEIAVGLCLITGWLARSKETKQHSVAKKKAAHHGCASAQRVYAYTQCQRP